MALPLQLWLGRHLGTWQITSRPNNHGQVISSDLNKDGCKRKQMQDNEQPQVFNFLELKKESEAAYKALVKHMEQEMFQKRPVRAEYLQHLDQWAAAMDKPLNKQALRQALKLYRANYP